MFIMLLTSFGFSAQKSFRKQKTKNLQHSYDSTLDRVNRRIRDARVWSQPGNILVLYSLFGVNPQRYFNPLETKTHHSLRLLPRLRPRAAGARKPSPTSIIPTRVSYNKAQLLSRETTEPNQNSDSEESEPSSLNGESPQMIGGSTQSQLLVNERLTQGLRELLGIGVNETQTQAAQLEKKKLFSQKKWKRGKKARSFKRSFRNKFRVNKAKPKSNKFNCSYKTKKCRYMFEGQGSCPFGKRCLYAHNTGQLRQNRS